MAAGGYKCVKFSWGGGRSDSAADRVKFILNGVADAIISADVGWELDTLTPTSSDFLAMPSKNATNYPNLVKVLKLEYNSHIYRLGLGYLYNRAGMDSSTHLKADDVCPTSLNQYTNEFVGYFNACLYFCMIKDGTLTTDATYNYVWDGQGQFLKWMPFTFGRNAVGGNASCADINAGGATYTYYVILKGAQIAILFNVSAWTTANGSNLKCIVAGEIFKETGHSVDAITFGAIGLNNLYAVDNEIYQGTTEFLGATPGYVSLYNTGYSSIASQIITAYGTIYSNTLSTGSSASNVNVTWKCRLYMDTEMVVYTSANRWTPVYMYLQGAHDTYYVVEGDGFKGFVDTDLLRGVNPNTSYGQQLDNGNFVYLGGGFAIGWDSSNTTLLF